MKKVLIVTPEIEGPVRNGGIATAFTALATTLAENSFDVTVLYTVGEHNDSSESLSDWESTYQKLGIRLISPNYHSTINANAPYFRKKSYAVYQWLKENNDYDTIIGADFQADLYYALLSKKSGLNFEKTKFIINTHGPSAWADEGNYHLPSDQNSLELYYMEKSVIAMSDELISPSQFLLSWMQQKGWQLPENRKVILNLAPFKGLANTDSQLDDAAVDARPPADSSVELIFFGRLELRKGLDLFLRSIRNLTHDDKKLISKITFLGKNISLGDMDSKTHIIEQTQGIGTPVNLITDYNRTQANAYIKKKNTLVIIASRTENSPYTVYECLINEVNFLAADVGGIPELIPSKFHGDILFSSNPFDLSKKIHTRLKQLECSPGLIKTQREICSEWISNIAEEHHAHFQKVDVNHSPLVSVCVSHFSQSELLEQAITSIQNQSYQNIEIIVINSEDQNTSSAHNLTQTENKFKDKNVKFIHDANLSIGASRNMGAKHALGEFVLFMDSNNIATVHEVESFVIAALNTKADICTAVTNYFERATDITTQQTNTEFWVPLGPDLNVASIINCFGSTNALVKKSTFDSIGGFTEDLDVGNEGWELFLKASLKGFKLHLIPEMLFWSQSPNTKHLSSRQLAKDRFRSYRPFLQESTDYNYTMSLIPSYIQKIQNLESEIHDLHSGYSPSALLNRVRRQYKKGKRYIARQQEQTNDPVMLLKHISKRAYEQLKKSKK